MSKLIIATPNTVMFNQAVEVIENAGLDAKVLLVSSQNVLETVARERENGATVVVARGNHAHLIKTHTDMPLIEIVLSGQELAVLIEQAAAVAGKPRPKIALIGFRYMFSDPEPFARILGVDVSIYYASSTEGIPETVEQIQTDGADVIIGGEIALQHAERIGLKSVFLGSSKASMLTAISMAGRVLYGIEMEQRRSLEFMSLLDYSFDVILKLDALGNIQIANYMAEKTFKRRASDLIGKNIAELLEVSEGNQLSDALSQNKNAYSIIVRSKDDAFVANVASIVVQELSEGYILSMQEFGRIDELEEQVRTDRVHKASRATATFGAMKTNADAMKEVYQEAAQYAQYDRAVLITGVFGTEKSEMAQCIHNASMRRKNPFVSINLTGLTEQMQLARFSGVQGEREVRSVFEMAHTGTLYIEHVDLLSAHAQLQLLSVLREGYLVRADARPVLPVNVRLICATNKDLYELVSRGVFLEALYLSITQLEVKLPSLGQRIEDMPVLIERFIHRFSEKYKKYVYLQPEAQALIHAQPWEMDVMQLELFIEKLVILAKDKHLDAAFVQKYLPKPKPIPQSTTEAVQPAKVPPVYYSKEHEQIVDALRTNKGNRMKTAQALGMSKSTLWRKMKKHGIESGYDPA